MSFRPDSRVQRVRCKISQRDARLFDLFERQKRNEATRQAEQADEATSAGVPPLATTTNTTRTTATGTTTTSSTSAPIASTDKGKEKEGIPKPSPAKEKGVAASKRKGKLILTQPSAASTSTTSARAQGEKAGDAFLHERDEVRRRLKRRLRRLQAHKKSPATTSAADGFSRPWFRFGPSRRTVETRAWPALAAYVVRGSHSYEPSAVMDSERTSSQTSQTYRLQDDGEHPRRFVKCRGCDAAICSTDTYHRCTTTECCYHLGCVFA